MYELCVWCIDQQILWVYEDVMEGAKLYMNNPSVVEDNDSTIIR